MKKISALLSATLVFTSLFSHAKDDELIKETFDKYSAKGTMIISSYDGSQQYIYNQKRSEQEFLPASTFKLLNTLIGLKEGVITKNTVFKWDSKDKGWDMWNKDQTLKSALSYSCVWCYQQIAKQVGNKTYLEHFNKVNYGNKKTGPNVQRFWLDGELRVTAQQQIDLVKRIYDEKLPYPKQDIETLKNIMVVEKKPNYTLYGKTGWANNSIQQVGWFIGFVETKSGPWFFAMNIEMTEMKQASIRKSITKEVLLGKKIIF
ncbi:class D beta-lactamase [Spartinivicinus ruber]|uniref:class D beta-lactamase n=1 Tax=Spartinivicinus ruber TaxID=2683272 RepID=UPI0013D6D21A|nr:class D beta-lactamase [Spartinivicinus ruber]